MERKSQSAKLLWKWCGVRIANIGNRAEVWQETAKMTYNRLAVANGRIVAEKQMISVPTEKGETMDKHTATELAYKNGYANGVKEFAEKIAECLKRYSHLHKYANEARHSTEEFADGTPMEMISVWDVFPLEKWGMVEYETMNTLQENIETIAKERLLTEFEKDFMLLVKEMVGADNA